ncbi:hypothetical protein CHLNCDRAFT_137826 [Chlorella variabilis]|uniref:Peptidase S8/S53 domain-containing protein n=1 Tax=Chlorella variabilis TaxID=554065 RepID=E1Z4L0_CHLVA|nr:hypothetical protein CHLNCDRAFT_137826 [Chlorella variabilis]EFN59363.1 hypothetical protein CHLNCDRAFT_137826 [Chlorella variabilis]|eukprot:XP_005851465.1 hypothetical protein CHLNCDRAFT_137826 [Chlorella variabilis]
MASSRGGSRLAGGRLLLAALIFAAATALPAAAAAGPAGEAAALPPVEVAAAEGPLAATVAAAVTAAAGNVSAAPAAAAAAGAKFSMIVVLRDASTLARLRMMCATSPLMYRLFYRALRLPADCHMPGVCKRIYSQTISGFAGEFGEADLARLERCLPPSSVFYREPDAQVFKAEDSSYWHPPDEPEEQQAPQQAQQQARRAGRRLQQGFVPRVEAFEERQRTPSTAAGPIDEFAVSQGRNISDAGPKGQTLSSQLWNLDRIDQRDLPLDGRPGFALPPGLAQRAGAPRHPPLAPPDRCRRSCWDADVSAGTGRGTTIYVVDSGIRLSHQEFLTQDGSRSRASYGYDFVEDDYEADDCDGHGTHVSGTAIGLGVGVAKEAEVVGVRILDCTGSGTISDTVAALDWVAANHRKPAVVTLSLGIQVGSWSRVLEDAVRSLINTHGVTVVVASGNSGVDACYVAPANVPEVITVSASNLATKYNGTKSGDPEDPYKWSNSGPCIDLFAPGVDIFSACGGPSRCEAVSDSAYTYASGTSMAVPHVAGVAAAYLSANPEAAPRDVAAALVAGATLGKVVTSKLKPGTANRLLYSRLGDSGEVQAANGP